MNPLLSPGGYSRPPRTVNLVADPAAILAAIETLIQESGLTQAEIARRLGVRYQSVQQYKYRTRPSLLWMIKLATVLGGKIWVEFPGAKGAPSARVLPPTAKTRIAQVEASRQADAQANLQADPQGPTS